MTHSAHDAGSTTRPRRLRAAALIGGAAALVGAGVYLQRHREELATLGEQHGVAANPQT